MMDSPCVRAALRGVRNRLENEAFEFGGYWQVAALIRKGLSNEQIRKVYPKWDDTTLSVCRKAVAGQLTGGDSKALNGSKQGHRYKDNPRSAKSRKVQRMWAQGASVTEIMEATGLKRRSIHELVCGAMHGEEAQDAGV